MKGQKDSGQIRLGKKLDQNQKSDIIMYRTGSICEAGANIGMRVNLVSGLMFSSKKKRL